MNRRHQLRLVGITYNQIESGVYAVILEEIGGSRRIPIVIGYPEAQAIECKLQEVVTPRPLTHDLMLNIMENFGLILNCVEIRKLPNGVFAADLIMEGSDGQLKRIDSRSSDAIAIAIRAEAPIFTSYEVLEESGFSPKKDKKETDIQSDGSGYKNSPEEIYKNYSDKELEEMIANFAKDENYEEAALLQSILRQRKDGKSE